MVSKISAIKTQLITDIETTSIDKAYEGRPPSNPSTFPWAQVEFFGGTIGHAITEQVDLNYHMIVSVHGEDREQVEVAIEELAVLYNSAASIAALRALGVQVIHQTAHFTPLASGTQQPVYGDIDFAFRVRYT